MKIKYVPNCLRGGLSENQHGTETAEASRALRAPQFQIVWALPWEYNQVAKDPATKLHVRR